MRLAYNTSSKYPHIKMKRYLIKPCALSYLNQWYQTDRQLVQGIASATSISDSAIAIRDLAIKYQVIRTFEINKIRENFGKEEVEKRWQKVAHAVQAVDLEGQNHEKAVHDLANILGGIFQADAESKTGDSLISAATKFLWFQKHTEIRIYDKRAVVALNQFQKSRAQTEGRRSWLVNGEYKKYAKAWQQEFLEHKEELVTAIDELPQLIQWSFIPLEERAMVLRESRSLRFKERVFDKYLWTLGEKSDRYNR